MKYKAQTIKEWDCLMQTKKGWIPAKPISYWSFKRFKLAWGVLVGRYDALDWEV